jgi:hypothetical protein
MRVRYLLTIQIHLAWMAARNTQKKGSFGPKE